MNKRTLFCIGEIMYINEQYHDLPLLETKEYRFISRDGQLISKQEQILKEHLIDVYLNDHLTMKLVCLPQYLTELVLGRLLTERIIDSISDIEQIYICEYGKRAKVYLNRTSKTLPQNTENNLFIEITPTCCTGNHILNDYFVSGQTPKTVPSINWKPDWIFQMADAFADGMPLHSTTFATHSCLLARNGQILFSCEDIGRVKIPALLRKYTGKQLEFDHIAGLDRIARPITDYALIIQCGGCMITATQLRHRLQPAIDARIPVSNYGMTIAWLQGIFDRATQVFTCYRPNPSV